MLDGTLCTDYHVLEAILIIKYCLTALKIAIPLLLIILGSIDFVKSVIDPNKNTIQDQAIIFAKRIASAALIFLVPTVISITFSLVGDASTYFETINACMQRADSDFIKELKEAYRESLKKEQEDISYEVVYDNTKFLSPNLENNVSGGNASFSGELLNDATTFIEAFEGSTGYCNGDNTKYVCKDIGDGTLTVGPGVTSYTMSGLVDGQCYSVTDVEAVMQQEVNGILTAVEETVAATNPSNWNDAKTIAAVSIGYNCGTSYGKKVVQQYAASGNDGALSGFKSCTHASNGNAAFTEGLKKRRDIEYDVFINGDLSVISQKDSWTNKYIN